MVSIVLVVVAGFFVVTGLGYFLKAIGWMLFGIVNAFRSTPNYEIKIREKTAPFKIATVFRRKDGSIKSIRDVEIDEDGIPIL